ncbi:hypothetical protein ANN_16975 [Periplaneta americana]|uniref:Uncharacterized protein n=1 Tax=Periplaneta americana TaxID=6978 RepID=A0ABQ8SRL7_PERAM|nr:hypothetical protein ANN_16975 [Periplaneta americana]
MVDIREVEIARPFTLNQQEWTYRQIANDLRYSVSVRIELSNVIGSQGSMKGDVGKDVNERQLEIKTDFSSFCSTTAYIHWSWPVKRFQVGTWNSSE